MVPSNAWGDVTAEWGGSFGGTSFPSETSSLVNNVTLSTAMPTHNNAWLGGTANTDHYNIGTGSSIDIKASDGYKIKQLKTSVWYSTDVRLTIHFSASSPYDGNILKSVDITGHEQGDANLYDVEVPNGAKSARIVSTGTFGYGAYFYRLQVTVEDADPCSASVTASFSKAASETGEVPANKDICTDYSSSFTIPGKNTLVYDTKHAFVGWKKDGVTYAEDSTYTITDADKSAGSIEFTAVWREVNVTDLTITDPVNNTIPLSWKIPGICDLSLGTTPIYTPSNNQYEPYYGTLTNSNYDEKGDFITANGNSPIYGQYGIGFDIPATTELSWLSYEWKGYNANVALCATACSNSQAYWDASSYPTSLNNNTNWTPQGPYTLKNTWWSGELATNPEVSQIVIFANVGTATNGISFSVRNVRYGITGRADIDHIVLVRKEGAVPANVNDGNQIYTGTKSHFTDTDVKTPGTTYYYAVFAVYSDATVSSPVYVSHTMEAVDTYTVTYAKGAEDVTGEVPTDVSEYAAAGSVNVADKNTLARAGYTFGGWSDGSTTYAPGASYTMPAHNVTFTAVWTPFTVPMVTNLSTSAENEVVTLTYSIPGICDLSNPVEPKYQQIGNTTKKEYKAADYVEIEGNTPGDNQFGVAFAIPTTTNIDWLSFDYRGSVAWNVNLWGGLCDAEDGRNAYWQFASPMTIHPNDAENWSNSGQLRPNQAYWQAGGISNPVERPISQIAVYANASGSQTNDISFEVKNVRYHVAGQEDIHHVVIMRKAGQDQASTSLSDGTLLEPGTKSKFVDNAAKAAGWYTYTVFAVHADGTLSAGVSTNVNVVISDPHTVTYALGGGTGTLPTEPSHVEGASFTVANGDGLSYAGHTFAGWNDGTSDYAPGDSYTMPDENVVLTAQWDPIDMPEITNLQIDASSLSSTTLSWKIPGIIDLTTASTSNITEANYASDFRNPVGSWTLDGEVLDVTYTCGQWAMCGIAFPISLNALESLSVECKANDNYNLGDPGSIILGAHAGSGNVYYGAGKTLTSLVSDFVLHSQVFTKKWYNNAYSGVVNNVDEVCVFINPNPGQTGSHFYIQNLRYHTTGMIDIDHVVVMRKEDSPSTGLSDGTQIYSGTASHWVDEFVKDPHKNYYYTVFAVHADGVAISDPVSVVYNPPAITPHTRSGLRIGDYGTICLPYAVAAADRTGAELFEIESWAENGTSMTMTQLNENENMIAGRPYIFQATANTATFSYYVDGEEAEAGIHNGLIGSYVEAQIQENDNNYIIYNNKLYLVNAPARVGAYRAYIHRGGEYSPAPANRRRVTMGLYGTQTTTDINQISTEQITNKVIRNGHLFILRGDKIYNAQGQLVQ
ncbi:MAG: InlB B-repeat-containing protein [Paludibacteraceae bacterium]|nr:InlB B-repeat-containing protein [Paludibacteraceae bacterium]